MIYRSQWREVKRFVRENAAVLLAPKVRRIIAQSEVRGVSPNEGLGKRCKKKIQPCRGVVSSCRKISYDAPSVLKSFNVNSTYGVAVPLRAFALP